MKYSRRTSPQGEVNASKYYRLLPLTYLTFLPSPVYKKLEILLS